MRLHLPGRPLRRAAWLLTLTLLLAAGVAAQGGILARIQTFRGPVSVARGGQNVTVGARNFGLSNGDRVVTGPAGAARVVAVDGKRATMGPNSELRVGTNARGADWRVAAGKVAVFLTGRGRTEVSSPGAIAAAEGTGFQVEVAADGTSVLTVVEGTVDWYNDQGRVQVTVNQQSTAVPGQAPTRPIAVDASGVRVFEATVENLALPMESPRVPGPRGALAGLLPQRQAAANAAPNDAAAQAALGDVQLDLGQAAEALTSYQRAQILAPNDASIAGRVSLAAIRLGRSDVAAAAAARAQELDPNGVEGPLAQGRLLLARGDAAAATPLLQSAADHAPNRAEPVNLLGLAQLRARRTGDAEKSFREALHREPELYTAHAYLSSALVVQGRTPEAEGEARRAVELAPESSLAREALGGVLVFSGRPADAVTELRRAVELDPLASGARAQLARALAGTDQIEAAEVEAARAVAGDPNDAGARTTLGVLFSARRDYHRAGREFGEALRVAPNQASARTGLGSVEIERGRFGQALKQTQAALDLDSGSPQAYNNLGAIYTANGRLQEAVEVLNTAVRLQPSYALPHANLAIAHLELNEYAEALREGLLAVKLGERSALLRTTLARIYIRQFRYDRALAELRRAETLDPLYPLQYFYLAQLYRIQGRDRDGIRSLLRGLALDPGTAAEQRQYARTEGTVAYGKNARHEDLRTSGRADRGNLTYFVSGSDDKRDSGRAHSDITDRFIEGILGYQPNDQHNLVFFTSHLDERGQRPGRLLSSGLPQDPNFNRDFTAADIHLLDRMDLSRTSYFTIDGGFRRAGLFADNRANPSGNDPFLVRDFGATQHNYFLEGQYESFFRRDTFLRAGMAYTDSHRDFNGRFPDLSGSTDFFSVTSSERPSLFTGWAEVNHRFDQRFNVTVGLQGHTQSHSAGLIRPKVVARYRSPGGTNVALLAYPLFDPETADLLPVETWQQSFELGASNFLEGGSVMNYELAVEHPLQDDSLLSGVAFYRTVRGLLINTVDPDLAPLVARLPVLRGEIWGGQVAYEHVFFPGLSARVFGRYTGSRDADSRQELAYLPRWQGGVRLDYVNRAGIRAQIGTTYIGSRLNQQALGDPGNRLGGYFSTDLRLSWQQNLHLNYFIQVSDLFDRGPNFFGGFPTSGRSLLGGIDFRF